MIIIKLQDGDLIGGKYAISGDIRQILMKMTRFFRNLTEIHDPGLLTSLAPGARKYDEKLLGPSLTDRICAGDQRSTSQWGLLSTK